jgi:hypothetical protein
MPNESPSARRVLIADDDQHSAATGQAQDVERAKAADFDHHLSKPMEAEATDRLIRDEAPSNNTVSRWPNKRFR